MIAVVGGGEDIGQVGVDLTGSSLEVISCFLTEFYWFYNSFLFINVIDYRVIV